MAVQVKKYNLNGDETGSIELTGDFFRQEAHSQMVKDYLVALRANQRQWSASTQTRAEVNHSTKKPHPQKGTGNARQGFLGAPQYRGGGRVGAPRPKFDQHIRVNKKERRAVIRSILAEKIKEGCLHVLECQDMAAPKTRLIATFLKKRGLDGKRVLFLTEGAVQGSSKEAAQFPKERYAHFFKSGRNLKKVSFLFMPNLNGYDAAINQEVVVMAPAIDELKILLKGSES